MILVYHKIFPESYTEWWVDVETFYRQMQRLRHRQPVFLDDYDSSNPRHVVITFDDVYRNVLEYAAPILKKFGYPFELFVIGDLIGKDNEFDAGEPFAEIASTNDLKQLVRIGGRLQWHTRTHPDFQYDISRKQIRAELKVPEDLRAIDPSGMKWLAYPYGNFNDIVLQEARQHFVGAVSCIQGTDNERFRLNRITVTNSTTLEPYPKVAVVIPSYNYGTYLPETVESVLRQSQPPDEIHIADDCSDDETEEIGRDYERRYPQLVRYHRNEKNLGIVANFNAAIARSQSDYLVVLDADNRLPGDYIESLAGILDREPDIGIAYTDFALFGPRARLAAKDFPKSWRGDCIERTFYVIHFPEFESVAQLKARNFVHGNSMYRRAAYDQAGGYRVVSGVPEDHDFFTRIVELGWSARRYAGPLLEYRQHSTDQAQNRLVREEALNWFRRRATETDAKLNMFEEALKQSNAKLAATEESISRGDTKLRETQAALRRSEQAKLRAELLAAQRLVLLSDREKRSRDHEQIMRAAVIKSAECEKAMQQAEEFLQWTRALAEHRLSLLRVERAIYSECKEEREKLLLEHERANDFAARTEAAEARVLALEASTTWRLAKRGHNFIGKYPRLQGLLRSGSRAFISSLRRARDYARSMRANAHEKL